MVYFIFLKNEGAGMIKLRQCLILRIYCVVKRGKKDADRKKEKAEIVMLTVYHFLTVSVSRSGIAPSLPAT